MEKYKKGGYTILDLESSTIYADSFKALDSNKPVVVYDGTNKPYFADTISLDDTSVVITKGGKTITIANDNTITNVGDIQSKFHQDHVIIHDTTNTEYNCLICINDLKYNTNVELDMTREILEGIIDKFIYSATPLINYRSNKVQIVIDTNNEELEMEISEADGSDSETVTLSKIKFELVE